MTIATTDGAAAPLTFAIPFYSGINYLPRAIESLLAQSDGNWKAFVCDNASPEPGVEALVQRYGDSRLGYLRNKSNYGMARDFNRCLDLAETDLVTLLHADDELLPRYCGTMRAAAGRHPTAVAFFCRAQIIGSDNRPAFSIANLVKDVINPSSRREGVLAGEAGVRALLNGNFIMAPTLCFRKSVLGSRRFPEEFKFVLDLELTTSLLLEGESLVGLPEVAYRYRQHQENTTAELTRTQVRFREESAYFDRMRRKASDRGWEHCRRVAEKKRIIKLNLTVSVLESCLRLRLGDARRRLGLLREL
jgi:glycosyltransferase involved in cell wall biosynthesis